MVAVLDKPAEKIETPDDTPAKSVITLTNLKHALRVVGAAIQGKTTIPTLACVRMEQLPEGLALETTDLDIAIRAVAPETGGPAKALLIPADKFTSWTKLLAGDEVKISATDRRVTLQSGRARAVLPVMATANWPDTDTTFRLGAEGGPVALQALTLTQGTFARALRFAAIAISYEESRYTLNGLLLQGDGETLQLVATDGHRLLVYSLPCPEKITALLPGQFIKAMLPLLADGDTEVHLAFNENSILASIDAEMKVYISSHKLSGNFPNWTAVVPSDKRTEITVNAKDLLASLERCALLSDERSGLVALNFDERIVLSSASSASGESEETVDCVGRPNAPLKTAVNSEYLIDLLKKLAGEVTIALPKDGHSPLLLKAAPHDGETLGYVVMPMRV